jgi:hypothetical protein
VCVCVCVCVCALRIEQVGNASASSCLPLERADPCGLLSCSMLFLSKQGVQA